MSTAARTSRARLWWFGGAILVLLVAILWARWPWTWSPVDDPSQVLTLRAQVATDGPLLGPLKGMWWLAQGDYAGGIFRPMAWIYPKILYLLPVGAAHSIRLLILLVALAAPVFYVRRQGARWPRLIATALIVLAASHALYVGLLLLSLQELCGAALIGAGLLTRKGWLRIVLWTAAAFFKAPFAWVLIGNAVALWRGGRRRQSVVSGALGVATLAVSFWWSRSGTYSSSYGVELWRMWANAERLIEGPNVLLLLAILWWLAATQTRLVRRPDWIIFGIGWAGYTLMLLPWAVTAYYMGPITYLFGLLVITMLDDTTGLRRRTVAIALVGPFLAAAWAVRIGLQFVFVTNELMTEAYDCLAPLTAPHVAVGGTWTYAASSEGPIRMGNLVQLENPLWQGVVVADESGIMIKDPSVSHYMTLGAIPLPEGRTGTPICTKTYVTLYQLAPAT